MNRPYDPSPDSLPATPVTAETRTLEAASTQSEGGTRTPRPSAVRPGCAVELGGIVYEIALLSAGMDYCFSSSIRNMQ